MIALCRMVDKHRAAFEYDTQARLGLSLSEVRALPCSRAAAYLHGVAIETGSHAYASITGQTFTGSQADLAVILLAQAVLNMGRGKKDQPVKLPNPYMGGGKKKDRKAAANVSAAEKATLTARLNAYSSIPD